MSSPFPTLGTTPERGFATRRAMLAQALASAAFLAATSTSFLKGADLTLLSPAGRYFSLASYAAYFVELHLAAFVALAVVSAVLPRRPMLWVSSAIFGFAQVFFYVDQRVFALFRFHVNRFALEVMTQPGAFSVLGLQWWYPVLAAGVLVAGFVVLYVLAGALARQLDAGRPAGARGAVAFLALAGLLAGADKLGYAWFAFSEIEGPSDVATTLPKYPRASAAKLFTRLGATSRERRFSYAPPFGAALPESVRARYPLPEATSVTATAQRRPNILVLGAESFRADVAADPEAAPRLRQLAAESVEARRHLSGSNCTHLGLFSLMYSASGFNWEVARQQKRGPFPIATLRGLGYDVRYATSVTLDYFNIEEFMFDAGDRLARYDATDVVAADRKMTDDLKAFLGERHERPFFLFGFFNATHHNYLYPPEHEKFTPVIPPTFSHQDLELEKRRAELFNRYKNSVHYVDSLMGELVDELKQRGLWENTIVVVTGDHGESFWEDGRFTHASAFSDSQTHVPMLLRIPGVAPRAVDGVTQHVDVFPTIFKAMGVNLPAESYSDGADMLEGGRSYGLVAGCYFTTPLDYAVIDREQVLPFRIEAGKLHVARPANANGQPMQEDAGRAAMLQVELAGALKQMQHFAR